MGLRESPDCSMPFEPNTSGPVPSAGPGWSMPRGLNAGRAEIGAVEDRVAGVFEPGIVIFRLSILHGARKRLSVFSNWPASAKSATVRS